MADLTLDNVTKVFTDDDGSDIVAVDNVSIDIDDGEFLVLVGPSGCGKSTTLRMVAGLETITSGDIQLGDTSLTGKDPQDRDIAMVFQSYALYPHMTVRTNMSFGLQESTDLPDDEIDTRVEETAEMMGIGDLLDRKPGELSGGQQQRVALGRAIVRDPEVFLMDEPLSNLDAKLRSSMRTELQRLQEDLGVTTIYVTHDQTEAMTMADKIAILNDGKLQQVGTPLECYHEPANLFVAGFIGEPSMNFFDVERVGEKLVHDNFEYELSDETANAVAEANELVLGIRPEDIELRTEVEGVHDFETTVDVIEPMGDENNVYLTFDGASDDETFVANISGMQHVESGQPIVAHIPEVAIHVFERRSGNALRNRTLDNVEELHVQL
ncbi:carbohydrate ABC transporter ATP-binding protein, CUT1 family [Natronoarchaeum philippinense]|uniref:ABC-type D-xylose/L-arabinose transporter n=1 Tax=Natronoarchaeum philippinense TaxID=558529 RepID=A0A285N1Y2_NATPI|nr:sn-glycerol-3-phosphate ABC transporter ATP-binding protein UgpC [Natronoarchaeum philippinense]SNZ03449.1 carbohydrate ABC transporter ATP-binding protein, CUT1 family [Natronoarchaeum philippinense]